MRSSLRRSTASPAGQGGGDEHNVPLGSLGKLLGSTSKATHHNEGKTSIHTAPPAAPPTREVFGKHRAPALDERRQLLRGGGTRRLPHTGLIAACSPLASLMHHRPCCKQNACHLHCQCYAQKCGVVCSEAQKLLGARIDVHDGVCGVQRSGAAPAVLWCGQGSQPGPCHTVPFKSLWVSHALVPLHAEHGLHAAACRQHERAAMQSDALPVDGVVRRARLLCWNPSPNGRSTACIAEVTHSVRMRDVCE